MASRPSLTHSAALGESHRQHRTFLVLLSFGFGLALEPDSEAHAVPFSTLPGVAPEALSLWGLPAAVLVMLQWEK